MAPPAATGQGQTSCTTSFVLHLATLRHFGSRAHKGTRTQCPGHTPSPQPWLGRVLQLFPHLFLASPDTSWSALQTRNLKSRLPLFSSVMAQVFLVPLTRAPKLMNEAGAMLYLLNRALADTRTGMMAMVSPPSQRLGSITCSQGRGW